MTTYYVLVKIEAASEAEAKLVAESMIRDYGDNYSDKAILDWTEASEIVPTYWPTSV